ncbi:MFS transporter [Coraliomargarita sp. SDUM461004]|uniref:MFS transporter n=1 Tax=Thalassobacterium sedimentorum TaxID=3041258 RepID=A0ABU1AP03_9BACT|nr:MFS transporter [Coraliomargarita sp. SDUM461004]MDQ8195338.1 MFS transporter [Coraliomargarita sp. SDUM461004]
MVFSRNKQSGSPSRIPDADRIPLPQKAAFSFGYGVDYLAAGLTTSILWMPFFNIGLGISPMLLGVMLMVLRAWDALTDPIMGNISDNTRTRFGRRRPYILIGALLTAALYLCLWRIPEGLGAVKQFTTLCIVGILFFTCFTMWSIPFYSLQMELTPNYDERTRLSAWVAISGKFIYLCGGWVMALATCKLFADPETGEADIVAGMQATSWLIAIVIVIMGLVTAIFVKERYYETATVNRKSSGLIDSIKESLHCAPLWYLIGISFFLIAGSSISNTLGQYVSIYILFDGDLSAASVLNGWRSTGVMVIGIISIPVWTWLSEYLDKKIIVSCMLAGTFLGHTLNVIFINPDMPYLWLISSVFESGAIGAVWLFLPSMKADVADYDELDTDQRREGSLNAFYSWFVKVAFTVGAGMGGFILQSTGFDANLDAQSAEALFRMKWVYILLPLVLWSLSLYFIIRYPLKRDRMGEIRSELEMRRGQV